MEKKQKNIMVTVIMVVGVIFILTAGCIFVRQAWQYLPDIVKQGCLFLVAVGSLVGSFLVGRTKGLQKTEQALFYIGDAFLGYFTLSVSGYGWIAKIFGLNLAIRLFLAVLIMMLPMILRFILEKRLIDYSVSVVFANVAVIFLLVGLYSDVYAYLVCMGSLTLFLFAGQLLISRFLPDKNLILICAKVCFYVQEIYTVLWLVTLSMLNGIDGLTITVCENVAFLLIVICVVLSSLVWYDKSSLTYGIQVSVLSFVLLDMLMYNLICGTLRDALVLGIAALILLIVAAIKNNRVYVVLSSVTLFFIAFYVTRSFWLSIAWWIYMFVAGVILVLIAVKKEREGA